MNNSYKRISNFGPNTKSEVNNPLTYCMSTEMNNGFLHGGSADNLIKHGRSCQLFLSEYCAKGWDKFCEVASKSPDISYPAQNSELGAGHSGVVPCRGLTAGEALINNTAARKYLNKMHGGRKVFEPFDPTVADSPLISYWVNDGCASCVSGIPEYVVNPETIDDDIVMHKILDKPSIATNILINIYNTMKRYGTLSKLEGTRLGHFYQHNPFFRNKGGL